MTDKTYPHVFIGRCQTCLGNAVMSSTPCPTGYGNGMPLVDRDCAINRARADFDKYPDAWVDATPSLSSTLSKCEGGK